MSVINEPRFSVIIPAYNAEKTLTSCLRSLADQSLHKGLYEVILVDDGSSDNTAGIAKGFDVKYIFQTNQGPASARNNGVASAKGEFILFTDSDCVPDHRWIEEMVKPFQGTEVVAVKGAYKTKQKTLVAKFAQAEFEDRYDFLQKSNSIDMIDTYSAAFKKDLFLNMGGFDSSFPVANNEDTELSYRLSDAGYHMVFNPHALVYHVHPDVLFKYLKLKFWRGYWRMVVYRRYPDKAVRDSYTPEVIKIQTLLMAISLIFCLLVWTSHDIFYLVLLLWGIIVVSAFPFSLKTFKKERDVGLISPGVILLRSLVFGLGSLLGVARCLWYYTNNMKGE